MPEGLQVFDQYGALKVDITMRIPRLLGVYFVGSSGGGSITHPGILTGEPQCFCIMHDAGTASFPGDGLAPPDVYFSGDTMFYGANSSPQRFEIWVF